MLADNEFWATVINSSANWVIAGAMVVQTIIFFITFKYGFRYLDQHREKIKEEHRQKIIIECIQRIIKIKGAILQYYAIPEFHPFDESRVDEKESTIEWILKRHYKNSNYYSEIDVLMHELNAYFLILNNEELNNQFARFPKVINSLNYKYEQIEYFNNEHFTHKAWEMVIDLKNLNHGENPDNLLLIGFNALNLMANDLQSLYMTNKIKF